MAINCILNLLIIFWESGSIGTFAFPWQSLTRGILCAFFLPIKIVAYYGIVFAPQKEVTDFLTENTCQLPATISHNSKHLKRRTKKGVTNSRI